MACQMLCKCGALHVGVSVSPATIQNPLYRTIHCASAVGPQTSYLHQWVRAKERCDKENLKQQLQSLASRNRYQQESWQEKECTFERILQVTPEARDRAHCMHVADLAAPALAAAQSLLSDQPSLGNTAATLPESHLKSVSEYKNTSKTKSGTSTTDSCIWNQSKGTLSSAPWIQNLKPYAIPCLDFWTWSPRSTNISDDGSILKPKAQFLPYKPLPLTLEEEVTNASLSIPFKSMEREKDTENEAFLSVYQGGVKPLVPLLQSLDEVQKEYMVAFREITSSDSSLHISMPAVESKIASVMQKRQSTESKSRGISQDGSYWWKERATEKCANGVLCTRTVVRGVNADGTEWEEKIWEAFDEFYYKELGAEKSGRDALGNVWCEFWKELMWKDLQSGLLHMEKSADKWAKNGYGGEWHEKWWEQYDESGFPEKWADKWSKIDPTTSLEAGHAHLWHERWGEKFDGQGGAMKYSDKWAERSEMGGAWSKWGDKWDEHFDKYGHGVKQGETWCQGTGGERWNRTWGEEHNGAGWVHKYGQSSSGEHWDTHVQQETWYEAYPHFGFHHCLRNSQKLQYVGKKHLES